MWLFEKKEEKETLVMKTEQQKDEFIDRLEKAHVPFEIHVNHDDMYNIRVSYSIRVNASDLKKVS